MSQPLSTNPLFTLFDPGTMTPLASVQAAHLAEAYARLQLIEQLFSEPLDDAGYADCDDEPLDFSQPRRRRYHAFVVGPQDLTRPLNWPIFLEHYFAPLTAALANASAPGPGPTLP